MRRLFEVRRSQVESESMMKKNQKKHHCWIAAVILAGAVLAVNVAAANTPVQERVIRNAVARVAPTVVQIQTSGGKERIGRMIVGTGPTTGLVVSADGHILSSAFNFVQQPSSIVVALPGGTRKAARLIARDSSRMLVMLKVDVDRPLEVPEAVPLEDMRVGQWTIAVGRTFATDAPNMSVGILSATNRIWSKAIQTDAKISPSTYGGPLIDVQGRVFGILVPLSPQQQTEVAGAEWYDSGIGFAIPLAQLTEPVERMKKGEDLFRGILGVTLKGGNMFADPAIVATSVRNSPAAKAGIKPKDRVIEIDGQTVSRQTHLKHALGPKYAGDTVHLVALRGAKRVEFDVELAARVDPYVRPYLGILPRADIESEVGVGVRHVLPNSPAAAAGLKVDDRILQVDSESIKDSQSLRELLATREPGETVELEWRRDEEKQTGTLVLASEPEDVPAKLPPRGPLVAQDDVDAETEDAAETVVGTENGAKSVVVSIKAAAEANKCFALIPSTYREDRPHGVLIWLSAPSAFDEAEFLRTWASACEQHELIVLAPQPNDEQRWVVTEAPIVAKLYKQLDREYAVDAHRVVVHGYQGGASLAYRFAFENRDFVHGVAVVDAAVPLGVRLSGNDSVEHLAFWVQTGKDSRRAERVTKDIKRFREMKFPVTERNHDGPARYLEAGEVKELVRWVDIQDRI